MFKFEIWHILLMELVDTEKGPKKINILAQFYGKFGHETKTSHYYYYAELPKKQLAKTAAGK